jgi:nucleotide-binding universal stress UspA family protein
MYEKVLVPLDGSKAAESVLSQVKTLAASGGIGEVILLHVVDIPSAMLLGEGYNFADFQEAHRKKSMKYLHEIQSQLSSEGIKAGYEVIEGRAAQTIIEFQKRSGVDLTVMASHGHSGAAELLLGSVAHKVLHHSLSPVLLVRVEA